MISCKAGHFIPPHREHKGFKQRMGVASPQATGINGPSEPSLPPTACAALLPPPPPPPTHTSCVPCKPVGHRLRVVCRALLSSAV